MIRHHRLIHKFIKVHSAKAFKLLNDPRINQHIKKEGHKLNFSFDIPYIAGYSKDGKTIYIDRHFNPKMGKINLLPFILTHEKTEKAILDIFKLHYQDAHHLATHAEKLLVDEAGLDWKKYTHHFKKYVKELGHEKLVRVPKDLDLTPYKDEHDAVYKKLLAKINGSS